MSATKNRFDHINKRIHDALMQAGRSDKVTLLAVSKKHSAQAIKELYQLGQTEFGESYLQEALEKKRQLEELAIHWHFIGPIQSNKSKEIAQNFAWVHSLDRIKIARRLSEFRPPSAPALNICLQVNISQETQKSGFNIAELDEAIELIRRLPRLRIRGLMSIPKATDEYSAQRIAFRQLAKLAQDLQTRHRIELKTLSMGMSGDLEAAIAEGATIVRIGTDLFGPRQA